MVYFQTKNPNLGKFSRGLHWKRLLGILHGRLVYFTDIGYNLWPLVYLMVIWYIFSRFGKYYREKSGNPDPVSGLRGNSEKEVK
jgi:hypothetical protein